jgi:hypothetical protein
MNDLRQISVIPASESSSANARLINGAFNNGSNLTLANNASIVRDAGTLSNAPTFAGAADVLYVGATNVNAGNELPTGVSVLRNLIVNKTAAANTVTLSASTTVNGGLALTNGKLVTGGNILTLAAAATTSGSSSGYVIGNLRKINPSNGFVFPVGTANGYSPMALPTVNGTGNLTVSAVQSPLPNLITPSRCLQRYWSVVNSGLTSARLQFYYLPQDVSGNPANYRIIKDNGAGGTFTFPDGTADNVDEVNRIGTLINPTTTFSNWSMYDGGGTTASEVELAGHIRTGDNQPLAGVRVQLRNSANGEDVRYAFTDGGGNYRFANVPAGETYVVTPTRRGFDFAPNARLLSVTANLTNVDFAAARNRIQAATSGSDFDADGQADLTVFRPSNGTWYVQRSSNGAIVTTQFGMNGDVPISGDYDGDGVSDYAVFRQGNWYILNSRDNSFRAEQWGLPTDQPVTGDFDGDGKIDLAVFRPAEGNWYIRRSSDDQIQTTHWGQAEDKPVVGDFDGDGKSDLAVFRPSNSTWHIQLSGDNSIVSKQWGAAEDQPVAADYDGDGQTDIAVFRPTDGNWYILESSRNRMKSTHFGANGDIAAPSAAK